MAHRLTGILLVGGRSVRFGSSKSLAMVDGETLAERAWRLLGVCDARIAVGKGIELPFDVLDDGNDVQAPIVGVIAGLRAAETDRCVVVPVDCPWLTPETVLLLGERVAVPQTGPLPGGYAKSMLPELERRLASGELSLRGVNENVIEVDERELRDVDVPDDLRD